MSKAFWQTMRRTVVMAGCVDLLYFALFMNMGVPELAWPNVSSVVLYAVAYWLIRMRFNAAAMTLVWVEVLLHATVGTILIGWESGFHHYLLLFVPAIVVGSSIWYGRALLLLLFVCYTGLDVATYILGPTNPIPEVQLAIVRWINVAVIFAMFAHAAVFYRATLRGRNERVPFSATHDPLTCLPNRFHFMTMAEHELAWQQQSQRPMAIAVLDIDKLGQANLQGMEVGDAFLAQVGRELRHHCRLDDVVGRWESDEFVMLIPGSTLDEAVQLAERVRHAVAASDPLPEQPALRCTVSIGVSEVRPQEPFAEALIRADRALQLSKRQGRDRVTSDVSLSAMPARPSDSQEAWSRLSTSG